MANITITSTVNSFTVVAGNINYKKVIGTNEVTIRRDAIKKVYYSFEDNYVCVEIDGVKDFLVAPTTLFKTVNGELQPLNVIVDSIDGVALTTLEIIKSEFSKLMQS
jgi:hypothetical protein